MTIYNGDSGDNWLLGGAGIDTLRGGGGNDTLDGGGGLWDFLFGGIGDDVYLVDSAQDEVMEFADEGVDTVISSATYSLATRTYVENLTLTGIDNIGATGNQLRNILLGNVGNNLLIGGLGADTMVGGRGDDTYVVDDQGDVVTEADNQGSDSVNASVSYLLKANLESLTLTGTAAINGTGNELDNVINGNNGRNALDGGLGNDTLDGGLGADTLSGGWGDDQYVVSTGDTVIELAGQGVDEVLSTISYNLGDNLENLTLTGRSRVNGTGNDLANRLNGNPGLNVLTGGLGNDTLDGGEGSDTLKGGVGNDDYWVDQFDDVVLESVGEGFDRVHASDRYTLTANLEDLELVGKAANSGAGNDLNNRITGNAADNWLTGNGGADTLAGGQGNDTYVIDGLDTLVEQSGEGLDTIRVSTSYNLARNFENLVLMGDMAYQGVGNEDGNYIVGSTINNLLQGLGGHDTLNGDQGADTLVGGLGDDVYLVDNANDRVIENVDEGVDTIVSTFSYGLTGALENLTLSGGALTGTGNEKSNRMTGQGLANVLDGAAGDDTLDGGFGSDTLIGGLGDDLMMVDNPGDLVVEYAHEGTDTVQSTINYTLGSNVEHLILVGQVNGTGNELNNRITGSDLSNVLDGAQGADTLMGGAGDDTYQIDAFDLVVEAQDGGDDTVVSAGLASLDANVENLLLIGSQAVNGWGNELSNRITGNLAGNALMGGQGDDTLDGGLGVDTLDGGAGNDTYVLDRFDDVVIEAADGGTDRVVSKVSYSLQDAGHVENLSLAAGHSLARVATGNAQSNDLMGNEFDDLLVGLGGDDVLTGDAGIDTLVGGAGNDLYRVDRIEDVVAEVVDQGMDTVDLAQFGGQAYALPAQVENLWGGRSTHNLAGNASNNVLVGGLTNGMVLSGLDGQDSLYAASAQLVSSDTLDGGSGADYMSGAGGNDTYVVDDMLDVVDEGADGGDDTVRASASYALADNIEVLVLTGGTAQEGRGNALANILVGNAADNVLDGGGGSDTMSGGAGNDVYVLNSTGDLAIELTGEGKDRVKSIVSYTLGANIEEMELTGGSNADATGNELNNLLIGNRGTNTLDGGAGADTMAGGSDGDTYVVDNLGDVVMELDEAGIDTVRSALSFSLLGTFAENLSLIGDASLSAKGNGLDNILVGNMGNNILWGFEGRDVLDGGLGADTMVGGAADDWYRVDHALDLVIEADGEGTDTVESSLSLTLMDQVENLNLKGLALAGTGNGLDNVLQGNDQANRLSGAAGNDSLSGAEGHDTLLGGEGADDLNGGVGNDLLIDDSASSNDTYRWGLGQGVDTIVDAGGASDTLRLAAGVLVDQIWLRRVGANLEVSVIGTGDQAIISGWYDGTSHQIESITLDDGTARGKTMSSSGAQQLVDAMAGLAPPPAGQTTLPDAYRTALAAALAANWV
jgi:Ca2+-binding RTX toxin-like protein